MKNFKINASVIGLGVGEKHLEFLKKNKYTSSITIFDTKINKTKKLSKKFIVKYVDNAKKIISDKKINLIVIASPDHTHCDYIIDSLNNKKHIFTEKPIRNNLKELKQIVSKWKKNNN